MEIKASPDPLFDSLPVAKAQIVKVDKRTELERVKDLENHIFHKAVVLVEDALCWRDIDPGAKEQPADWQDMDPDEAAKRLRVANAAWMDKKTAPVGLNMAKEIMISIIKARAMEKTQPIRTLNIMHVQMTAPLPEFAVIDMEEADD